MGKTAVRATSQQLRATLGEPDHVDVQSTGSTLMRYSWRWSCGCRAEGTADRALCAPCDRHAAALERF